MQRRVRQRISSYLSATLLLTLLSSGIVAPEITAQKADAVRVQSPSEGPDVNKECDQRNISTTIGVDIRKIGDECVIQFRAAGTYTWASPEGLETITQLLVVGGGGAGAARHGGGGGAGGLVYKTNVKISPRTTYSVVVGEGGGRASGQGPIGGDSLFNNTFRAKGGGGGGSGGGTGVATNGGSGGGSTGTNSAPGASIQQSSGDTTGFGSGGGRGTSNTWPSGSLYWTGGGGGGAGGAGETTDGLANRGGNGGAGRLNDITGELVCYAAGGGGGTNQLGTGGLGGSCIHPVDSSVMTTGAQGGNNAWVLSFQRDLDAAQNTGSGGGGGGYNGTRSELGGAGGRGVVVIRYRLPIAVLDLNAANYPGTGTSWPDTRTTGGNGVLEGAPTFFRANQVDSSPAFFRFDGARSQYVSTTRLVPADGPVNFSGGVWFRTTSNQGAKILGFENTQRGTGTGSYDRHLYIGTDNKLYWGVYDGTARVVSTTDKVNDGRWHYAFFTSSWTEGGNIISLSLDNGPAQSLSHPSIVQPYGGWWRLGGYMMNGWPNARTGYYTGDIARATIFPWVLSPEQARDKFLEMHSPTKVTALASTTATEINVSWDAVPNATGYSVNLYNAAGTALIKTEPVGDTRTSTLRAPAFNLVANTGYRVSVTTQLPNDKPSLTTFFRESPKSDVVVPNSAECSPTKSISGPYTILRFTTGTQTTSCKWQVPTISTPLEYLIVGGGGGGGQNHGGGGQGGYYNAGQLLDVSNSTVTITVGAGGAGGVANTALASSAASPLRNGQEGSASVLTTSSRAIAASGGGGGLTTWSNLTCGTQAGVNRTLQAKSGTPVIGRDGLAGGLGGQAQNVFGAAANLGTAGPSLLSLSATSGSSFARGGNSGVWTGTLAVGQPGTAGLGNGGNGGSSGCYGGGSGGSGTVILRYLTPLAKGPSPLVTLPETGTASIYAHFLASDYNTMSKVWRDSSGNNRDGYATSGNPQVRLVQAGTDSASNAKNDFLAVTGGTSEAFSFFALPKKYTLFHVARYNGANKNRIIVGTDSNWLSGFWAGRVGVAYHGDWLTANGLADNKNPDTDWIISADRRNNYRSQGTNRTLENASYQVNPATRFGINDSNIWSAEKSDFQVAEILVYNRELSDTEVAHVESYLQKKYIYDNPDVIGYVAGGSWGAPQYCPSGQVAVGVKAEKRSDGLTKFQMVCQSLAVGGESTTGIDALTVRTNVGTASGVAGTVSCSGLNMDNTIHTQVVRGLKVARADSPFVGGLTLVCGSPDPSITATTESAFFGTFGTPTTSGTGYRQYFNDAGNPALCDPGKVVIGFNPKSGSVIDAIQPICGTMPLPTMNKPGLAATSGVLKSLTATWDTITAASSYTINLYDTAIVPNLISTAGLTNISSSLDSITITAANFPDIQDSTQYRISVIANGDGIDVAYSADSELSEPAATLSAADEPSWSSGNQPNDGGTPARATYLDIKDTITAGDTLVVTFAGDSYTAVIDTITGSDTLTAVNAALRVALNGEIPLGDSVTATFSGNDLVLTSNETATTFTGNDFTDLESSETFTALNTAAIPKAFSRTVATGVSLTIFQTPIASTVGGTLRYQWYKNDIILPEEEGQFLTLGDVTNDDSGQYKVLVTNTYLSSVSSKFSDAFTLNVLEVITPKSGLVGIKGAPYSLQIEARGTAGKVFSLSDTATAAVTALGLSLEPSTGVISGNVLGDADSATIRVTVTLGSASVVTEEFRLKFVDAGFVLDTPTSVTLQGSTSALKSLDASWQKVDSATTYSIQLYDSTTTTAATLLATRGLDAIPATTADTQTATITIANYPGLLDGENYTIRVIAVDTNGAYLDSDASETASGTTILPLSSLNLTATVEAEPDRNLMIADDAVVFTARVQGALGGTFSYQWFRNGALLVGETGETLNLPSIQSSNAGLYTVEVTNVFLGETATILSSGFEISVTDGVEINRPINGLVGTNGKAFRLQLTTSTGTAPIEFSIAPGYTRPDWLSFDTLTAVFSATSAESGFYPFRVVAKDVNNTYDTTSVFVISIVDSQLTTASAVASTTPGELKSITVSWAAVTNANRYLVRLYDQSATNGSGSTPLVEVGGITGTSYILTINDYTLLEDNKNYKVAVVAIDGNGRYGDSEESTYSSVTTNRLPEAPIFEISPLASASAEIGDPVTLISRVTDGDGVTYQWFKDGSEIAEPIQSNLRNLVIASMREADAGEYSVVATRTLNGVTVSTTAETKTVLSVAFSVETPTAGLTAAVNKPYSLAIRTFGGPALKTFEVTSGTLPDGLRLVPTTGEIKGTPETVTSVTDITVSVRTGTETKTTTFKINVVVPSKTRVAAETATATANTLKSIGVRWGVVDADIHFVNLYDDGGDLLRQFVWNTSLNLPFVIDQSRYAGLSDDADYKIGIIAASSESTTANSIESDLITVRTNKGPEQPIILTQPLDTSARFETSVTLSTVVSKGDEGVLTYQWFKGSTEILGAISENLTLPSLAPADLSTYRVRVTNTLNGARASVTSRNAIVSVLTDLEATTPTSGLKMRTGAPYRLSVESSGGAGDNTWSVANGILPSGLALDSKTAIISGTPSESLTVGTVFTITLKVQDRYNTVSDTDPFLLTLVESTSVLAAPILTAQATLDSPRSIDASWTLVESATSYSVYLYDAAGNLLRTTGLSGLTGSFIASTQINTNNYPDIATATKYFVAVVANYDGPLAVGASLESTRKEVTTGSRNTVVTPPPTAPTTPTEPSGVVVTPVTPTPQVGPALTIIPGAPFNLQVNAPGANTFTINSGALPAGLTLDPRTGLITGTPTQSGPYSFSILATPPTPGTLITYSGNIVAPPAPTIAPTPTIVPGQAVNIQVNVPGANSFTVYGGALPAGLSIDPRTGLITGTPTQSGPYDFTILATPPATGTLVRYTGNIEAPAPTPQSVPPIELRPGSAFDFTPSVPGATNFALRDGALPAGLTLDPATGRISGTPRESGPYSFSIIATPPTNGVLLTFSGTIEAPGSTVVAPVVNPTVQTLDPITPTTSVIPQVNSNLLVVSSGSVGTTTVLPNSTGNGLIVTSSDVVLSVAGIRANGNTIPLAQGSQLTVQAGAKIEAAGTGFLPNSEIYVYMFSTPQLIGKVKTDAEGNYSEQLTVPANLASGNHILQVNGFLKSNEVKSISLAVIVTKTKESTKKPTTKPAATKDKKIAITAKGVVIPFTGNVVSLDAAKKRLIKQLQMPKNKSKEVYVLGYTKSTGKPNDILVALNRAINVSKEIQRLNPKTKVGYAGLGVRTSPVCTKQKNICAVVTIR